MELEKVTAIPNHIKTGVAIVRNIEKIPTGAIVEFTEGSKTTFFKVYYRLTKQNKIFLREVKNANSN